ncbi:MAG: efflux RND transporter permease subunit [Byssovorax sp.]
MSETPQAKAPGGAAALLAAFATRYARAIVFIVLALCAGGIFAAMTMKSSVFPETNFPRVVILVDNGVMPADEMMATITRPIEEAMKDLPGAVTVRSTTSRGSADVNVFFGWNVDMEKAELYVLSRLGQLRSSLPTTAQTTAYRLTFSAFPIAGISLTSDKRSISELWEIARYTIKPRFLQVPGVARVDLVGGRTPEIQIVVNPARLSALHLSLPQITDALARTNVISPVGMHEENDTLYLTVVDGRVHDIPEIEDLIVASIEGHPIRVRDFAQVKPGEAPEFNVVTAGGVNAVLLNVRSQPDGSTLEIVDQVKAILSAVRHDLPPDLKLAFYYDQSLLVRASVQSVWEAIGFGLVLSVVILYLFLRSWGTTLVATLVIPVTVLLTLGAMKALGMSFNLMTLGGIAAAIGLVVDDAIVVVEAIWAKMAAGCPPQLAIQEALHEIFRPLVGSTLTPVVVFLPLAFLDGVPGVFFRALALTMVVSLLSSLVLAVTLTPTLAAWILKIKGPEPSEAHEHDEHEEPKGFLMARLRLYDTAVRGALHHPWITVGLSGLILLAGAALYLRLDSDFLPEMDEGGFVIDYVAPPGTSLTETNRALLQAEEIVRKNEDVESYSRRTGAALGFHLVEPNTGDFLIKLKPARKHSTKSVISDLRKQLKAAEPHIEWEFPGILGDLIGDLTWSPEPIEIKIFSSDLAFLKKQAPHVAEVVGKVKGVVDLKDGLVVAGPAIRLKVRPADAQRFGLDADDLARAVNTAILGVTASSVLQGDRVVNLRVRVEDARVDQIDSIRDLPIQSPNGTVVLLSQVADVIEDPGQLEMHREDLRENVAVTARLEGRDLGSAVDEIRAKLEKDPAIPPGTIAYGGLYEQQQASFKNLVVVLVLAIALVFTVLLLEFRAFAEPIAIVFGSVLALFGSIVALTVTGTSLNIISFLGAIIGVGIVAKNGILMLDLVDHLRAEGHSLEEALIRSGRRRLRPVLMTSMAGALGMLPLAWGIGSGADMLKPMAIAVIGALLFSDMLSLVATPTVYFLLRRGGDRPTTD